MDPDPNNPDNDLPNPERDSSVINALPPDQSQSVTPQTEAPTPIISDQSLQFVSESRKGKPLSKMILPVLLMAFMVIAIGVGVLYFTNNGKNKPAASFTQVNSHLVTANNTFGIGVFNQIVQQTPQNNVFISPASISMALSMVYNGAAGDTKSAMQQTLNYQSLDVNSINKGNLALIGDLKNPDPDVTLSIANSVWMRQGISINKSFLNTVSQNYQAKASTLDFTDPQAPTTINQWVSASTHGKIPTIINDIPSTAIMYLINAVYFNGTWHKAFDPASTQNYPFTTGSGARIQYPLMSQSGNYKYFKSNSLQSIQLPYGKNQRLTMNVYLPNDMASFLKNFNYTQLAGWSKNYTDSQGTILLPKFSLNYSKDLNSTLANMGMGIAFRNQANFANIAKNLKITDVQHETFIKVNEKGTEAAAATSVGMGTTSAAGPTGFYMQVDKPFLFTIQDSSTGEILFVGVIENPSQ